MKKFVLNILLKTDLIFYIGIIGVSKVRLIL